MSKAYLSKKTAFNLFIAVLGILFLFPGTGYALPLYPAPPLAKKEAGHSRLKNKKINKTAKLKNDTFFPPVPSANARRHTVIPAVVAPVHIEVSRGETKSIYLSRKFINRIVFPRYIEHAKTLKTGDVSVSLNGRDATVVFSPYMIESGAVKKVVYPETPSSIVFKSGSATVSLVVVPKNIPSQTVYVSVKGGSYGAGRKGDIPVGGGFSKYVSGIFKYLYENQTPKGYSSSREYVGYKSNYPQISISLIKKYKGRFTVLEFLIKNLTNSKLTLSNKEFLRLTDNILAISLSHHVLFKNTYTRLFILTKGDN